MKLFHIFIPIINIIVILASQSYKIHNIKYFSECVIDVNKYTEGYIPSESKLYFRMKVVPGDTVLFQIKVLKNAKINMLFDTCGYPGYPSDFEILYGSQYCRGPIGHEPKKSDDLYDKYIYHIETFETSTYIYVMISNYANLQYLSAFAFSAKSISKYKIIDIGYKNEYQINDIILLNNNINSNNFLFIINNKNDNEEILINVNKNISTDINDIFIIGFNERNNIDDFVKNPNDGVKTIKLKSKLVSDKYKLYQYPLETMKNNDNKYLAIGVSVDSVLNYFSIYVGKDILKNFIDIKNFGKTYKPFWVFLILNLLFILF